MFIGIIIDDDYLILLGMERFVKGVDMLGVPRPGGHSAYAAVQNVQSWRAYGHVRSILYIQRRW